MPNNDPTSGFDWEGMRASTSRSYVIVGFIEFIATAFCGGFMVLALYLFKNTSAF